MIDLKELPNYGDCQHDPDSFLMAVATQRSTWPINMRFIY